MYKVLSTGFWAREPKKVKRYYIPRNLPVVNYYHLMIGAKVYITGRKEAAITSVSNEISAHPIVCDHSSDKSVQDLFAQIDTENNGQLDFLVNNCFSAGLLLLGKENDQPVNKFWELDPLVWDQVSVPKNTDIRDTDTQSLAYPGCG